MSVTTHFTPRRKPVARRRRRVLHDPVRAVPVVAPGVAATVSARRAGGPQDSALYECGCGCRFRAAVSTTVGCPACGGGQTW